MGIITILWEKWVEFRRDFYKITLAAMIAPLMYLVVFGMGIQTISHGEPYLNFLIPGVVSLTTMNGSFNAIAQNLNVQRLYEKAFDQVLISPTPLWQFIAGQIIGGSLRGFYAGGVILVPEWSCFFCNRCCRFIPCQKPCRCTAFFELHHHANGISVQYIFLYRKASWFSWKICLCTAAFPDKSYDPKHLCRRGICNVGNCDTYDISDRVYSDCIMVYL